MEVGWVGAALCLLSLVGGSGGATVPQQKAALLELGDPCARIANMSVGSDGAAMDSPVEQEYLRRFFAANSVDGEECVPWAEDSDPCEKRWTGVICGQYMGTRIVKELRLAYSRLVTVPASFSELSSLEAVDFQHNLLVNVPESLPEQLTKLRLSGNRIKSIADSLQMSHVQELHLAQNELTELPGWFGGAGFPLTAALGKLDLANNLLSDLPPHFCESHGYDASQRQWRGFELDLDHNRFVNVPASLAHCTALTVLRLSSNDIRSIPVSIGTMVALQHLVMDNNDIETVAEEIGQLSQLSHIDLSYNQIDSLPESASRLYRLMTLKLGSNKLEVVPESVRGMVVLEHLDLSDNELVSLPAWIGNSLAHTLQYLSVRNNKLTALPEELSQLERLRVLQADGNFLHGVPRSIMRLHDSGSLVQLTVCQEAAGSEVQRNGRCECGTGTFGSGPNCMACAEVEEDELVDVSCPSGPTADALSDRDYIGNYLTAIYPGPGYWLNQSDIDDQLRYTTAGEALVLPDLECNGNSKYCVGTDVDRDWTHSVDDGRGIFMGMCQGTRRNDETNATCMELVGLVGEDTHTMSCVQPPYFCAANHTGRFCATCTKGTRKLADGSCCVPSGSVLWTDVVAVVTPTAWALMILYSAVSANAADAVLVSLTFGFQTIRMVGLEKDWMHGVPLLHEAINLGAQIFSMELLTSQTDPCRVNTCPFFGYSVIDQLYWFSCIRVLYMLAVCCFAWLAYQTLKANPAHGRWDTAIVLHNCLLGVYLQTFMPIANAAFDIVIPRSYETVYGTEFLVKADPSVTFYDDPAHRHALWGSLVVICLLVLVIPLYIFVFSTEEVSKLQIRYRNLTPFVCGLDELLRSRGEDQSLISREDLRSELSKILKQQSMTLEVYTPPRSWMSSLRSSCNLSSSQKFERVTSKIVGDEQVDVLMALLDEDGSGCIDPHEIRAFIDTPDAVLRQKLRGSLLEDGWFSILFKKNNPSGWLFGAVNQVAHWYWLVHLVRRLSITLVFKVGGARARGLRLFAAFIAITIFMLCHWRVEPYPENADNDLEMYTLAALLVIIFASSVDFAGEMLLQECVVVTILIGLTCAVCFEKASRLNLKAKLLGCKCCPCGNTERSPSDDPFEKAADESNDASRLLDASIEVDDVPEDFGKIQPVAGRP